MANRTDVFVYSKTQVDIKLNSIISGWPKESLQLNLSRYRSQVIHQNVSCVSLLAHPIDDGRINTSKVYEIMCVAPMYTVYKRDDTHGEYWNLAAEDSYDLEADITGKLSKSTQYTRVKVSPVQFLNEKQAHESVSADVQKALRKTQPRCDWFDNSHGLIDEFVHKTTLMVCDTCKKRSSSKRFDGVPVCRRCRPLDRFEGVNVQPPKVFDISQLTPLATPIFTKKDMIDSEYVTFIPPDRLPFLRGDEEVNDKYSSEFFSLSKSVVYDIETVTVDETLKRKIPDEIVTITASTNTGATMRKMILFTRRIPDEWEDGMVANRRGIDTNTLLGDVRQAGLPQLPETRVILCPTEKELVNTFCKFLKVYRPHFIVSFNGHGFDHKYLIRSSIATQMQQPFHYELHHFTDSVKVNNKDPTKHIPRTDFMRPNGRLSTGLLSSSDMEVGYDSFPIMISIDLFALHDCSLNDACVAAKVNGCKLEGVAHTDIAKLYYSKHMDFFKYAIVDVVVTSELYYKDRFNAIELYMGLEQLVATPWNLSISRQKTMTAQTTTYVQFNSNGFIRKGGLRPKRVLTGMIVKELAEYFESGAAPTLDESLQLVTDFSNGHCKCNTLYKKLPKIGYEVLTEDTVNKVLHAQGKLKRPTDPPYSTVDALMLLFFLLRGDVDWEPFLPLLDQFKAAINYTSGNAKDDVKLDKFKAFCAYLVRVRKAASNHHETPQLLWEEYNGNHKMSVGNVESITTFATSHLSAMLMAAKHSRELPRTTEVSAARLTELIKDAHRLAGIKLKMLPYDGALIIFKKACINLVNPVCVFDFRSQYPNSMLVINLGIETSVSVTKVFDCIALIMRGRGCATREDAAHILSQEYVHVCFTRRIDDTVDWVDYLDDREYLHHNCIFFVRKVKSIQNHQFKAEIDSRVRDKVKSEDGSLTSEERKMYANKSVAKKVNINSRYGVIGTTINPRFQPTVTGMGRRSIQTVTNKLKPMLGAETIYGDTDSCFTFITGLNVFDMVDMTPQDMYTRLRFGNFGVDYATFKTNIYDKYYPVSDVDDPRRIRESGGGVVQELYQVLAPILSTDALELEAEKTLCPMVLSSMKKYTAHNCVTGANLTKGLSLHNKSAIPMTKLILAKFLEFIIDCLDKYDLLAKLYRYLGAEITTPIQLGYVDPKSVAKPTSINLKKIRKGTKQDSLVNKLKHKGVCFMFEKIHIKQVSVYPEGKDVYWSLCDILNQSCEDNLNYIKVNFDVLKEMLGIVKSGYNQGPCKVVEALIWGQFDPDKYTSEVFKQLDVDEPGVYKPMSFNSIISKHSPGLKPTASPRAKRSVEPSTEEEEPSPKKKRRQRAPVVPKQPMSSFNWTKAGFARVAKTT